MVNPVVVMVASEAYSFLYYSGGTISSTSNCGSQLDHAILAVGWGTDENDIDYILFKNQWDTTWGLQGYVRIAATSDNVCGIMSDVSSYPIQ